MKLIALDEVVGLEIVWQIVAEMWPHLVEESLGCRSSLIFLNVEELQLLSERQIDGRLVEVPLLVSLRFRLSLLVELGD